MPKPTLDHLETLLRRDRSMVIAALVALCLMAWSYTLLGMGMDVTAFEMTPGMSPRMPDQELTQMPAWSTARWILVIAMWWLMMIAMMIPSTAPTILLAAGLNRLSEQKTAPYAGTAFFVIGYLSIWLAFSVAASAAQWAMDQSGLISTTMASVDLGLTGAILIAAGLWQLTPIKRSCLRHCRSPIELLAGRAGEGIPGALRIGAFHGAYCLGCCWFLIALLFVGGLMNIFCIVGLALYVAAEKLVSNAQRLLHVSGFGLLSAGGFLLVIRF